MTLLPAILTNNTQSCACHENAGPETPFAKGYMGSNTHYIPKRRMILLTQALTHRLHGLVFGLRGGMF